MDYPVRIGRKDDTGTWTWETKVDVATAMKITGNQRYVAKKSRVPYDTINVWKKQEWWITLMEELRLADKAELNAKMSKIVRKSIAIVEDRLENGDYILNNKTGQIERKPVNMKEVASVANDFLDKQLRMEQQEQQQSNEKETIADTLKMLANEFAKLNRTAKRNNATDIAFTEVLNAVHDQREKGLQEGSGEIYLPPGNNQETSGAEQSQAYDGESR